MPAAEVVKPPVNTPRSPSVSTACLTPLASVLPKPVSGNGRPCACPVDQWLIQPNRTENYTGDNIRRQYPCGRELGFVDQKLPDGA